MTRTKASHPRRFFAVANRATTTTARRPASPVVIPERPEWAKAVDAPKNHVARQWFRITDKGDEPAEVLIYDEIGYWGVTATDFVEQLAGVKSSAINLRINSPGGEVWDGLAIFNALRNHKATINVIVDGLAASAASFIAMAGDTVVMERGARMMIHDASSGCYGNADEHRACVELLDSISETIAGIYAERAGGQPSTWRAAMKRESWYTGEEACAAGLADECVSGTLDDPDPTDRAPVAPRNEVITGPDKGLSDPASVHDGPIDTVAPDDDDLPAPADFETRIVFPALDHDLFRAAVGLASGTVPATAPRPVAPVVSVMPESLEVLPTGAPVFDLDAFRASVATIRPAPASPPPAFDPSTFRAAVALAARSAPEPAGSSPQSEQTPAPYPVRVDPAAFARALKEARQ